MKLVIGQWQLVICNFLLWFFSANACTAATFWTVNVGSAGNDGMGDSIRTICSKVNSNFAMIASVSLPTNSLAPGVYMSDGTNVFWLPSPTVISNAALKSLLINADDATKAIYFVYNDSGSTNGIIRCDANHGWPILQANGGGALDVSAAPDEVEGAILNWASVKKMVPMYRVTTGVASNYWRVANWFEADVVFLGTVTNNSLTASKLMRSDGGKGWASSQYDETDFLLANQHTKTVFAGNTGNQVINANTTNFLAINNTQTNLFSSDVSGGTRIVAPCAMTLTNLYVVASASPGAGKTCKFNVLTNGVATSISGNVTASTSGNDTTHGVAIAAGTEIGLQIVATNGLTAAKYSWGLEGK